MKGFSEYLVKLEDVYGAIAKGEDITDYFPEELARQLEGRKK